MAKNQKWAVVMNDEIHSVEYTPRKLFSKARIRIDDKEYPLHSAKLLGSSQEMFRLGGERAVISIDDSKRAMLTVDGETIKEI